MAAARSQAERDTAAARSQAERDTAAAREQAAKDVAEAKERARLAEAALGDLKGQQTERGYVLTLGGDVLFDTGKSALSPGAQNALRRVVAFLEKADGNVVVEGHTDAVGSEANNQALSERRANSVAGFLTQNGIPSNRVSTRGFGEGVPVVGNETRAGRQQNRRVEIVILNSDVTGAGSSN